MLTIELKAFMQKYHLETEVIKCLHNCLNNYREESTEEFNQIFKNYDLSKLHTEINSVSLKAYNWPKLDYSNVVIDLKLTYDREEIGIYQLYCGLDGEIEDDVLDLY